MQRQQAGQPERYQRQPGIGLRPVARWGLWLAILLAGAFYVLLMKRENAPFVGLALGCFAASSALSLFVLVVEGRRAARRR